MKESLSWRDRQQKLQREGGPKGRFFIVTKLIFELGTLYFVL